jgi:hypothetical protein
VLVNPPPKFLARLRDRRYVRVRVTRIVDPSPVMPGAKTGERLRGRGLKARV